MVARKFGEVIQAQWVHGDGSIDLIEHMGQFTEVGTALAKAVGMDDLDLDDGGFTTYRPLVHNDLSGFGDTLLFVERYADLTIWAAAECVAQRSEDWMRVVVADAADARTRLGEAWLMADDSRHAVRPLAGSPEALEWLTFDPGKHAALVTLPPLVAELADAMQDEEVSVRYLHMTTSAGTGVDLAHLWIDYASPATLGERLAWRRRSPELADWRRRVAAVTGSVRAHQLLARAT
jgi:hypothetical protein